MASLHTGSLLMLAALGLTSAAGLGSGLGLDTRAPSDKADLSDSLRRQAALLLDLQGSVLDLQRSCKGLGPPTTPSPGSRDTPLPQGATYTRWGSLTCPEGAETVYEGWAGGSYYASEGGAADVLCLPKQPEWLSYRSSLATYAAFLYGAEYQGSRLGYQSSSRDVPCAVCRAGGRTSALMVPARTSCQPGFRLEYRGHLMAGHHGHAGASQYVCVDQAQDAVPQGGLHKNGKMFYFVQGVCGSLNCPPYIQGAELACVVCSK